MSDAQVPAFTAALERAACPLRRDGVHATAVVRDARAVLDAAGRLQGYRAHLARARTLKARSPASAIDREVRTRARDALQDVQELCAASLRVTASLRDGGMFEPLSAAWLSALREAGPVNIAEEWDRVATSVAATAALERAAVSDDIVRALDEQIRQLDATLSADGTRLVVRGHFAHQPVDGAIELAARPARPTSVVELLMGGRFAALAGSLERGEPAYLLGSTVPGAAVRLDDLVLNDALLTLREGVRHVRKLEDAGLATYHGGDPGTIVAIGVICLIIGTLVMFAECSEDEEDPINEEGACGFGAFLAAVGAAMVLIVLSSKDPSTTQANQLLNGGAVIHGSLRDLEIARP